ncbi:MAG TPA: tetratricopeptide repeat protein [Methylophilaceae bacterium]|nr:tetratricopeptide repeat protein [Methylophilaceae bacterium]
MSASKLGRNDPCACGSGKKYKQCCMQKAAGQSVAPASSQSLNLALANFESGNFQAAISICQKILQADPKHFQSMTLLGVLAFYAGNTEAAVQLLERSIALHPNQPDAHNNLGEIHRATGNFQQAFIHFQHALKINPKHLGALINYGNALQDIYQYDEAISAYKKALEIKPDHTGALSNLANTYQQLYKHDLAIETFTRLLNIDADYDWALGGRTYSKIHCCNWEDYEQNVTEISRKIEQGKRPIKVFELRPISDSPALELKCAQAFANAMYPADPRQKSGDIKPAEKIKIAYLSADFRAHPVSQLLVEVLEQHNRSAFEIIGISFGPDDKSAIRERVIKAFDQFFDVRQQSDEQVASLLSSLNVQVAIDLMGYTTHARPGIFTRRAAPIQISYLGYAGTSGTSAMDYIIADDIIIPPQHDQYFSEQVIRLPGPLLPRDTSVQASGTPSRADAGLPAKGFVFCAFNNHYKISPAIFDIWMRLLKANEDSILWLSDTSPIVKANLHKEAAKRGVDAARIIFAKRTEHLQDHIARHALADLFLDTFPYNAHTTASDALWAGLPVLTCMGKTFASRVAASLLQSLNLPELITETLQEYETLALTLSREKDSLASIKSKLLQNKVSLPAFDAKQYAMNLEKALIEVATPARNASV